MKSAARLPWRDGVLQEFDRLGRWFRGRFATETDLPDELLPAQSLLNPDMLRQAIARSASTTLAPPEGSGNPAELGDPPEHGGVDLPVAVAVSRFTRHYAASLTTVALVGLSRGVGFDLSADRCTMIVQHGVPWAVVVNPPEDEIVRCAGKAMAWDVSGPMVDSTGELREYVWRKLYAENLWPVLELAAEIGKLSPNVVWTNAAAWLGNIRDSAIEYLGPDAAAPYAAESQALLDAPVLPGVPSDTNPLRDKIDYLPGDGNGFPETVQTRKYCCLTYLLADRFGRLCQSCPHLPLLDRIALIRERHGVPMGTSGGAAERRSIEAGLARPSTRRAKGGRSHGS